MIEKITVFPFLKRYNVSQVIWHFELLRYLSCHIVDLFIEYQLVVNSNTNLNAYVCMLTESEILH